LRRETFNLNLITIKLARMPVHVLCNNYYTKLAGMRIFVLYGWNKRPYMTNFCMFWMINVWHLVYTVSFIVPFAVHWFEHFP